MACNNCGKPTECPRDICCGTCPDRDKCPYGNACPECTSSPHSENSE